MTRAEERRATRDYRRHWMQSSKKFMGSARSARRYRPTFRGKAKRV